MCTTQWEYIYKEYVFIKLYNYNHNLILKYFPHTKRKKCPFTIVSIPTPSSAAAAAAAASKSLQSCPTLCDPVDAAHQAPPVPGILQARTLEWVAISFSTPSSRQPLIYFSPLGIFFTNGVMKCVFFFVCIWKIEQQIIFRKQDVRITIII